MKIAIPSSLFSADHYPKVFAWIDRFGQALKNARGPKPKDLKGAEALKHITQADFAEPEGEVDNTDPTGLKKGIQVESW